MIEKVRVWRFTAAGRNYPRQDLNNWKFKGSNNDTDWTELRSEFNYPIGQTSTQIVINTESYFQYYRLFVYEANGVNPGLRHFHLFVYLFIYYYLPEITMRQSRVSKHEAGQ